MEGCDNCYADKLRRKGGERCKLHIFEAIYDENGNNRRWQNFADIGNKGMGALLAAEKRKRKKPCKKGADGNGQYNTCIICEIHVNASSFVWIIFLAKRIMTMEAISAGRIKLPGPKIRRETIPQR